MRDRAAHHPLPEYLSDVPAWYEKLLHWAKARTCKQWFRMAVAIALLLLLALCGNMIYQAQYAKRVDAAQRDILAQAKDQTSYVCELMRPELMNHVIDSFGNTTAKLREGYYDPVLPLFGEPVPASEQMLAAVQVYRVRFNDRYEVKPAHEYAEIAIHMVERTPTPQEQDAGFGAFGKFFIVTWNDQLCPVVDKGFFPILLGYFGLNE